jgi:hypothetical protein
MAAQDETHPPSPCRLCGLEPETIAHLLVLCPHPLALKARTRTFYKIPGLIQIFPEAQIEFLLTRTPPPHQQKVKENLILAYFQALQIPL